MPEHWKHRATRCAVDGCERTRCKGWTTCALLAHHARGVSLYGLKSGAPRLRSDAAAAVAASIDAPRGHAG